MDREEAGVSVHGGFPNPATDTTLQSLDLNQLLIWHSASTFMMNIDGDDWEDQGIHSNDIAIIDRALSPQPKDKVIWLHNELFTISYFHRVPKNAIIWGVVTAIIHRYRSLL